MVLPPCLFGFPNDYYIDARPNLVDFRGFSHIDFTKHNFKIKKRLEALLLAIFRIVCVVYALIISTMLGKALSNFIRERTLVNGTIAAASALFFFSDLMLVFDWFIGRWNWTDHACMGTYYPALCLLCQCI